MSNQYERERGAVDKMTKRIIDQAQKNGVNITEERARREAVKIAERVDRKKGDKK